MVTALYVANGGDDSLSILCPHTGRVRAVIHLSDEKLGLSTAMWYASRVWTICARTNCVGAYCPATGKWQTVAVGAAPTALTRHKREVLCVCGESNSVWRLSRSMNPVGCMPSAPWPSAICAQGDALWVGHMDGELLLIEQGEESVLRGYGTVCAMAALSDGSLLCAMTGDKGPQLHRFSPDGTPSGMLPLRGWPTSILTQGSGTVLVGLTGQGVWAVDTRSMSRMGRLLCNHKPVGLCRSKNTVYVLSEDMVECIGADGRSKWHTRVGPKAAGLCLGYAQANAQDERYSTKSLSKAP